MKLYKLKYLFYLATVFLLSTSCEDLTEVNTNPNAVGGEKINPKYVFSSILANSPNAYTQQFAYGNSEGILEAVQYLQRDYIGFEINNLIWGELSWGSSIYKPLKDADYVYEYVETLEDENLKKFYQGTALIMKSFYYGFYTSLWGDMPYSEAMMAEQGVFTPKYDAQKDIFLGVIADLKAANQMLNGLGVIGELVNSDLLYGADALNWQKFCNSLLLRYYMRLSDKAGDLGLDVASEFAQIVNNPSQYPIFTSTDDNASIEYGGTASNNSWRGGPLGYSNRSEFYRRKPAKTLVDFLRINEDPRLTTWVRPVDVQLVVGDNGSEYGIGEDGRVKRYLPNYQEGIDTFLYVGLDIAMKEPDSWNLRPSMDFAAVKALDDKMYLEQGANPHTSYLADMYAENSHPLVKSILMTYTEVNFLLAEAFHKGWISNGSAVDYYIAGMEASLDQFDIQDGSTSVYNSTNHQLKSFDRAEFLAKGREDFEAGTETDQYLNIMTQKWVGLWMTPEGYLNWRRTAMPDLASNIISGSNGDKIPVRFIYGNNERNLNGDNVEAAISKLQPAENDQWSKMWLLQGTGKPW
ncbi:SusD/RagB family nutrient-binding outer membrane lipoprotein [Membranihabitans marinus]|uniref:SusD/RagB family nutrient-binding outer membrane lipoprotein n=1 Tax=Membranihabitans marinus TaxID=1227546 RepID=UPI001F15FE2C|nr:SusD/RagB family nutrient-binding outer membrane lipoprotein [Membranihabitans marinus]